MRNLFIIITALIALTSCDLVDFDVNYGVFPECEMELDKHEVCVMVGDTFSIYPIFTPDTLPNREVFYYSEPEGLLSFDSELFTAIHEGNTWLYAISVKQRLQDSCRVSVMKPWAVDADKDYPYDMVFYADVDFVGEDFDFEPENMIVGAFVDGECRGLGVMRNAHGIDYIELRVGSEVGYVVGDVEYDDEDDEPVEYMQERVSIKIFDRKRHKVYTCNKVFDFDGETHGTLSNLIVMQF